MNYVAINSKQPLLHIREAEVPNEWANVILNPANNLSIWHFNYWELPLLFFHGGGGAEFLGPWRWVLDSMERGQPKGLSLPLAEWSTVQYVDEQFSFKVIINCCELVFDPSSWWIISVHISEINKFDHEIYVYFRRWGINYGLSVVILLQLLHDRSFSRYKHLMKVTLCTYLTNVKPQILFISTPFSRQLHQAIFRSH